LLFFSKTKRTGKRFPAGSVPGSGFLALSLFMLGVGADNAYDAFAPDDLTVIAHFLDGSPHLHFLAPVS
jgi:hypothetical protein